jgi:hypothetical protein
MNNLQEIIVGLAVLVSIISIWAIYYFIGRIIYTLFDRWDDERMQRLIERERKKHSPTEQEKELQ